MQCCLREQVVDDPLVLPFCLSNLKFMYSLPISGSNLLWVEFHHLD